MGGVGVAETLLDRLAVGFEGGADGGEVDDAAVLRHEWEEGAAHLEIVSRVRVVLFRNDALVIHDCGDTDVCRKNVMDRTTPTSSVPW